MINLKTIEGLGLNSKEAGIYINCLQFGPIGVAELARRSGIQRTHVYDLAKKLINKGFLTQTFRENKKILSALPPKEVLKKQKEKLNKFEDCIPKLESLGSKENKRPKIIYYEGEKELKKMMEASTMGGGECLIFCDDLFYTKDNKEYQKNNVEQRLKSNTRCRLLAAITNAALESKKRDKKEARETRLLPKDLFEPKVLLAMYRDKTLVANHEKSFGFVVEDKGFSDTLQMIFDLIWNSGRLVR